VVILGSGMDTRPYRLPGLAQVPVYEVDLPTNINRKRDRVCRLYGAVPGNVALVPVDFETFRRRRPDQPLPPLGSASRVRGPNLLHA
jgi:O-methyltransferase involved in polyketide biosynthesis